MSGKICLLHLVLLAAVSSVFALPKYKGSYFNLTHVSRTGSFYAFYHNTDDAAAPEAYSEPDEKRGDKIYGGSYASYGQFPFMAIVHRLAGGGKYFVCGGSILSSRWILTAGHCIARRPQKFFVVLGVTDKDGFGYDYITGDGVSAITTQGALHRGYGDGQHDIGLLYMPKEIPFSDTVQPIRIAGKSYMNQPFTNEEAQIFGWGKNKHEGGSIQRLKYGRVTIMSNSECKRSWNVDETHICTDASDGNDVCQGDSGGPLVVFTKDDEPLQVGIVSYGDGKCPGNRPSVFTRVSAYASWIKRVTGLDY